MTSFTQSNIIGWAGMFMRPEIYVLSEFNPLQDPANHGAAPPDLENPMATEAESKHHCDLKKILINQHYFLDNIGPVSMQHLIKPSTINLNQCNKFEVVVLGITLPEKFVDGHVTATDISKIKTPLKPHGTQTNQFKRYSSTLKMSKSLPSVQILNITYCVSS